MSELDRLAGRLCAELSELRGFAPVASLRRLSVLRTEVAAAHEAAAEVLALSAEPSVDDLVRDRMVTPSQVGVLRFILKYRRAKSCSPTLQEIADALGVSKVTAYEHVGALTRKGVLRRQRHKARAMAVCGA